MKLFSTLTTAKARLALRACVPLLLLSSCSLPPEGAPHPVSCPVGAPTAATDVAPAVSLETLARDKRLPFRPCLEQALRHNLKVRIARLGSQAAAQEENVAKAAFDPVLTFNGVTYPDIGTGWDSRDGNVVMKKKFITGTELRMEAGTAFSNNDGRGLDYMPAGTEHVIRLSQPLMRGAGIAVNHAPLDLARIVTVNSDAMARAEVMEMLRATETAYWTTVWAKEALRVENDSLARSRRILEDVKEKHRLGAATKIDDLEAESAVAAANEQVERASQRYSDAMSNLANLLGLVPGAVPEGMSFDHLKRPPASKIFAEGNYQHALRSNPQEVLLANEVERRTIEARVARNALLPSVNLEVSNGSSGLIGFGGVTTAGKVSETANWSALLQVSIPWTSRAERAQAEQARLQLERSEVAREDGRRELRREIFESAREIESGRRQFEAAVEGTRVNQAKWEEQMQRHKEGVVSVRDLREAEAELQQASLRALSAQLGILVADSRLARLDGSILERNALMF